MYLLKILTDKKHNNKKHHCMFCLQSFTTEDILSNHKKQSLLINGCQAVNYELTTIKFANHNRQNTHSF